MINLTKHSVNGKISVKSLVKTFDEYQAKEKELANKMFHLRGVFPDRRNILSYAMKWHK